MRKPFVIILFWCLIAGSFFSFQQNYDTNAKKKSIYIYNFTKYFEWPAPYKQGDFTIGVLGETPMLGHLNEIASSKKAGSQAIAIKKFDGSASIGKCHILIVPKGQGSQMQSALNMVKDYSTLIITEKEGLARQGSGINFVIKENRQKFELNKGNIQKKDIQISSQLLSLAIVVE